MVLSVLSDAIVASIVREYGPVPSIRLDGNGLELIDADLSPMAPSLRSLSLAGNRLRDVRPLGVLTGLEELHLAGNEISDVAPLCGLSGLRVLDVSDNALEDSGCLFDLAGLGRLSELRLAGNPICSTMPRYAEFLFLNLPSLLTVDGITRDSVIRERNANALSALPGPRQSEPNSTRHVQNSDVDKKVTHASANNMRREESQPQSSLQLEHLESLLREMELAFAAQERVIAGAVQDPAALVGAPASNTTNAQRDAPSQQSFATLLTSWRRKMLQAAVLRRTVERDLRTAQNQLARTRAEAHQKTESLEALLERQRQRAAILLAENEDLRTRVADSEAAEAAVRDEMTELEAKSARTGNSFQAMRLFLDQYRSQMESNVLQMQQRMLEASQRLHDMEARVQSAAQRVQLGAAIVAQNNVKRRNAAAVASVRSVSLASSSSSSSTADDALVTGLRDLAPEAEAVLRSLFCQMDPADNGFVGARVLLDCALHPAGGVRDLLRAALDHDRVEYTTASSSEHQYQEQAERNADLQSASEDLRTDGTTEPVLSASSWTDNLMAALHLLVGMRESADLTWGEFLVVLSLSHPEVCAAQRCDAAWLRSRLLALIQDQGLFCCLSRAEAESLRRSGILGDADWAMLPLSFPLPPSAPQTQSAAAAEHAKQHFVHDIAHTHAPPGSLVPPSWLKSASVGVERSSAVANAADSFSGASFARIKKEALRLARERAFLLARVQEMNRTLERRVEASRSVFAAEIRKAKLREDQAKAEALDAQREAEASRSRAAESSGALVKVRAEADALKQRVATLEFEFAAATAEPAVSTSSDSSSSSAFVTRRAYEELLATAEAQTADLRHRLAKADAQSKLVTRESCKMEVQMKAMQRDLQKLQGLYEAECAARAEAQDRADYESGRCSALQQQLKQQQVDEEQQREGEKGQSVAPVQPRDVSTNSSSSSSSSSGGNSSNSASLPANEKGMPSGGSAGASGSAGAGGREGRSSAATTTSTAATSTTSANTGSAAGTVEAAMSKLALLSQRLSLIEQQGGQPAEG